MPAPTATAGRDPSGRTDTAWQSVIADSECRKARAPVNGELVFRPGNLDPRPRPALLLAPPRPSIYHRESMIRDAVETIDGPGLAPVAAARPIAIIAPKRR